VIGVVDVAYREVGHRTSTEDPVVVFPEAAAELEELERGEQEKLRLLDLWSFQRKEIETAQLEDSVKSVDVQLLGTLGCKFCDAKRRGNARFLSTHDIFL
jgi:adenine C2-methylase RlmN of 23S rRNA A2503 and tRNA A37